MGKKRFLYLFLSLLFLIGLVFWIIKMSPEFWWSVLLFFVFVFNFVFFLILGFWGRVKLGLWLGAWVVLAFFLRMSEASLFLFFFLSLLLWGVLKITP